MVTKVVCKECGAIFERDLVEVPFVDRNSFYCDCGNEIEKWSSTRIPTFRKVEKTP